MSKTITLSDEQAVLVVNMLQGNGAANESGTVRILRADLNALVAWIANDFSWDDFERDMGEEVPQLVQDIVRHYEYGDERTRRMSK